jgi:hypothetical protein
MDAVRACEYNPAESGKLWAAPERIAPPRNAFPCKVLLIYGSAGGVMDFFHELKDG